MKRAAAPARRLPVDRLSTAAASTKLATGTARHGRQPDRHHHRHGEAARAVRQRRTRPCSRTSSSTSSCSSTRCKDATIVPSAAVQRGAPGTFVYLVKPDEHGRGAAGQARARATASASPSRRAWSRATASSIDGADRLRDGAKVDACRDAAPPTAPQPHGAAGDSAPRRGRRQRRAGDAAGATASDGGAARAGRQRTAAMNPSRLFILRPVATSLLMVAILLVGIVAYRFLPLSALPEVDYPTIQVQTFYPGASPDVMTSSVTAPLEAPVRPDAGPEPDVLDELGRRLGHHPAVQPRPQPRRRRAGGAGGDQRGRQPACPPTCRRRRSTPRSIRPTRRS